MIARIGNTLETVYNWQRYFKTAQTVCQWASFDSDWKETSLQLIDKIKAVAGPFLTVGIAAASFKLYEFWGKIKTFPTPWGFFHAAIKDIVPLVRRATQFAGWCGRREYIALSEAASFRLNVASSTLGLIYYSHEAWNRKGLKERMLLMINALTLVTLFSQTAIASFALLVLKTSFAIIDFFP